GKRLAVRAEGQGVHPAGVPPEAGPLLATGSVPQPDRPPPVPRGHSKEKGITLNRARRSRQGRTHHRAGTGNDSDMSVSCKTRHARARLVPQPTPTARGEPGRGCPEGWWG